MADPRLPVIVLSGFPGAGKTKLLNPVLKNHDGRRVAVIVNDMSEVTIGTDHANVPAGAILDTGLIDFDGAHEHPLWAKVLYSFADHLPDPFPVWQRTAAA